MRTLLFMAVLVTAACSRPTADRARPPAGSAMPAAPQPGGTVTLSGTGEKGVFRFEVRMQAPQVGELFTVQTAVFDQATGQPVSGAKVSVNATMPDHGHGMITDPVTEETGPGQFRTQGMKFHMPGRWQVEVKAEAGGRQDVLRRPFEQPVGGGQ